MANHKTNSQFNAGEIKANFGNAVRQRRHELHLTQEAVAERADLHRTYVADVECGTRNLSLQSIVKIARALEVPAGSLFHIVDHPSQAAAPGTKARGKRG